MKHLTMVFAALAALAGAAAAEPLRDADRVHDFHSIDRLTPVSTFGLAIGYEVWDDDSVLDQVIGFDLSGHFVSRSGVGGYLSLPLSYVSTRDLELGPLVDEGHSEAMLGNIELGGLYARPLGKRADFVAHLGVVLPTASDDPEGEGLNTVLPIYQAFASVPRYGDLVQRWPDSTWLRLGFSPMGTFGPAFWRVDLGIDLMLDDDDDAAVDISPVLRFNAAAGIDVGPADVTAELATNLNNQDGEDADEVAHTLAIGARFDGGNVQPGLALILPLGFDNDNGVEDGAEQLDLAIAFSLTARMP